MDSCSPMQLVQERAAVEWQGQVKANADHGIQADGLLQRGLAPHPAPRRHQRNRLVEGAHRRRQLPLHQARCTRMQPQLALACSNTAKSMHAKQGSA